jgi:hypothetical protein
MPTRYRRKLRAPIGGNSGSDLRDDVREAIERVWPDGVVEMAFDSEESWFPAVYPKLASAVRRIGGARLVHEKEPEPQPVWFRDSDDEEEFPPDDLEPSRSYHLFFVCPAGEAFNYATEIESFAERDCEGDEDGSESPREVAAGTGWTGWSVSVSLLAPFAVITLSDMATFEDGASSEPSLERHAFTETGEGFDPEAEFLKFNGEQPFQVLLKLRDRICGILDKHGIVVLPEAEWRKPVPWLRADDAVFVGTTGEPIRVLDALFFEGL